MLQNSQSTKSIKRYFWLKLHADFFNRDEIRIIESQTNGKDYIIFYLKIMLKSINNDGKLLFKDTIPYTPEMLASITNTSIDTVRVAIDAFVKLGLITMLDDGALHMQEVQKLVGSESADAERKRNERANKKTVPLLAASDSKQTASGHCPENVTLDNRVQNIENTPLKSPPSESQNTVQGVGNIFSLMDIIQKQNYSFTKEELSSMQIWITYITHKKGPLLDSQIEINLKLFKQRVAEGYDICEMVNQSIAANYSKLMNPDTSCLKKHKAVSIAKQVRPHRFENTAYIIPESTKEKSELAQSICRWYSKKISPKTGKPMNSSELCLIDEHKKFVQFNVISRTGVSAAYSSWYDYVLNEEVHTGVSLLDQPINDQSTNVANDAAKISTSKIFE